jgi:hypothetical protein
MVNHRPGLRHLLLFLHNTPWLTAGAGDILFLLAYLYCTEMGIIGQPTRNPRFPI